MALRSPGLAGRQGEGCLTAGRDPQLPPQLPGRTFPHPSRTKLPIVQGNGQDSVTGQRKPCQEGVSAATGHPQPRSGVTQCLRKRLVLVTLFWGGPMPAPQLSPAWVLEQLVSSSPGFSHMPLFLSHVTAWASGAFLPPSSLARRSLQTPPSNAAVCWKGAPKIGWRGLRLAGLLETCFPPLRKRGENRIRMPLLTAGPINESGICTVAIQPSRGAAHPRGLAGDTGTPSVLPVPIAHPAARRRTRAESLCWVMSEGFWGCRLD